jgi:hypothetical protein
MSRTEYKNQFTRERYDRFNLVLPKGQKELLKEQCDKIELSVNEYIRLLIQDDMKNGASMLMKKMSGFTEEQYKEMDKWQIPTKYRDMIQDFHHSKEDGYFIRLKKGYINDVTGSRIIQVEKMQQVRMTINKSHKKQD